MTAEVLLSIAAGAGLGSIATAFWFMRKDRLRRELEAKLRSPLEDDLYPYYPDPRKRTEKKDGKVRGF